MPNTAKAEAIRKAWGEMHDKVEKHLNKDGYVPFQITELKIIFFDNEELFETTDKIGFNGECIGIELFRPKSLQGIENNRGWTRIESKEDLPKDQLNGDLFEVGLLDDDGNFTHERKRCSGKSVKWMWDKKLITHYQPIVKPEKPIY